MTGRAAPDAHIVAPLRVGAGETNGHGRDWMRLIERRLPDRLVLVGLLALAALLRFAFLAGRGTWDADQGHDMLVLRSLVVDGVIPLLGPPTSIGAFHHGAAYYYLLAPLALVSNADPTVVVAGLAAAGVAAVGVAWWLARAVGGRLAGAIAGLLCAVSPSAIEASTFLWNPNAIGLTAGVALAAAWRARTTGRGRWWVLAGFALGLTMQLHVLGVGLFIPIVGLFVWTWIRAEAPGPERRSLAMAGAVSIALILVQYVPLAIHEATTDFSETRAALDYLASDGPADSLDPVGRVLIVFLRVVAWPLVGLITDAPIPGLVAAGAVVAIAAWRWRARDPDERRAIRWFALAIVGSTLFLAVVGRGLTTVVPGLPNDHYHAFVDPMIFSLVGIGLAALARGREPEIRGADVSRGDAPARALVSIVLVAAVAVGIAQWPPATATDGGWPAAEMAGRRIVDSTGERPILLGGLPLFKGTGAYAFPLVRAGRTVASTTGPDTADDDALAALEGAAALVVVCDRLFEAVLLADCGDDAEGQVLRRRASWSYELVDRFEASARTVISVYMPKVGPGFTP